MRNYKRVIALMLAAVMAFSGVAMNVVSAAKLTDANKYTIKGASTKIELAYAIDVLQQMGIVAGVSQVTDSNGNVTEYTFDGDSFVTRQQFALFTARIESGHPERFVVASNDAVRTKTNFKDLVDKTYTLAIDYCYDRGYILGRDEENTIFDPMGNITFAEAVTMLTRTLGYTGLAYPMGFMTKASDSDVKLIGQYADFQMNNVAQNIRITRAEMAMLLWNYLSSGKDEIEMDDDSTEDTLGDDNSNTLSIGYNELCSDIDEIESKYYNSKGYVDIEDFDRIVAEVEAYVKKLYEQGKILEYEHYDGTDTIRIIPKSGHSLVYTPQNDEILNGGSGDVQIVTISPDKGINDITKEYYQTVNAASNLAIAFRDDYFWNVNQNNYFENKMTINTIINLSGKVILWNSHGIDSGSKVGTMLQTGLKAASIEYYSEFFKNYDSEQKYYFKESKTGYWHVAPDDTYILQSPIGKYYFDVSKEGYWYVTAEFINDILREDCFKGAIVYLNTCYSLKNNVLSNAFRNKGASVVIGNTDKMGTIYGNFVAEKFMAKMAEKESRNSSSSYSVREALSWAKTQIPLDFHLIDWIKFRDKYANMVEHRGDELFRFTDWNEPESTGVKGKAHLTEDGKELPLSVGRAKITNVDTGKEYYTGFINSTGPESISSPTYTYSFEIGGCPTGKYTLAISPDGKSFYDAYAMFNLDGSVIFDIYNIFEVNDKQVTDLGDVYAETVGRSAIEGKVVDEARTPLQNIGVKIYLNDNLVGEQTTTATGSYAFDNLLLGRYTIEFTAPRGYEKMIVMKKVEQPGGDYLEPPVAGSIPISNRTELEAIRNNLHGNYHLIADIDLYGADWAPLGESGSPFKGIFDGQGHIIRNMTIRINSNETIYAGLFGIASGSSIKNLGMVESTISVTSTDAIFVGGIVGSGGKIYNCFNSGNINANTNDVVFAGGISGYGSNSISYCFNTGDIRAFSDKSNNMTFFAGIAGNYEGDIEYCYNTGKIEAYASSGTAFLTGAGGIIGNAIVATNQTVTDCYNIGDIHTESWSQSNGAFSGGIVGYSADTYNAKNCYNIGNISNRMGNISTNPERYCGAIIGGSSATLTGYGNASNLIIENCHYLNNVSRVCGGSGFTQTNANSHTAPGMRTQSSFIGFDFDTIWNISSGVNNGYPYLRALEPK